LPPRGGFIIVLLLEIAQRGRQATTGSPEGVIVARVQLGVDALSLLVRKILVDFLAARRMDTGMCSTVKETRMMSAREGE
jgi:hypothetical protein